MGFLDGLVAAVRRRPRPIAAEERLKISYAPRRDGDADPGEVVWTWVPYEEDPTKGKDRPALVVGHIGRDVAVVPLTTKNRTDRPECIEIGRGDWDPAGRVSYALLDRMLRIRSTRIRREGGSLDERRFTRVVDALRALDPG